MGWDSSTSGETILTFHQVFDCATSDFEEVQRLNEEREPSLRVTTQKRRSAGGL